MTAVSDIVQKASIYDPSTGTAVELDGLFIDRSFEYSQEDTSLFNGGDGNSYVTGRNTRLVLPLYDYDNLFQLREWAEVGSETAVSAIVMGAQMNIQWYGTSVLRITPNRGGGAWRENLILESSKRAPNIQHRVNLLQSIGWADEDSDNVPDGFTSGFGSDAFSGGVWTGTDSTGTSDLHSDVVCPVEGVTVTLSVNITSAWDGTAGTPTVRIHALDFASSVLDFATTSATSTGRKSVSLTLPADTYKIRCIAIRVPSITASGSISLEYPSLRADGASAQTQF